MLKQQDHLQVGQKRKKGRGKFARIKKGPQNGQKQTKMWKPRRKTTQKSPQIGQKN